jgi:hypothetical protein
MKKQKHLFKIVKADGRYTNFERLEWKRLSTCIDKLVKHHANMKNTLKFLFDRDFSNDVEKVQIYKTDYECAPEVLVWEMPIAEYLELVAKAA